MNPSASVKKWMVETTPLLELTAKGLAGDPQAAVERLDLVKNWERGSQ